MQRQLLRIGIPVGLQLVTEVGFFGAVQLLMGGLGTLASASHQAALMMASMTFSVCLGVGAATSVQVGRAIGAGRRDDLKSATALGLVVGVGFMTLTAVMMWTVPGHLAGLMTNDPTIVDAAIKLLMVAGFFQIVDGIQAITAGALRGAARTREAFVGNLIGHWLVGMPSGLFLCYGLGMGGAGLWWGLTIGLTVTAVILVVKLKTLLGGEIVAIGQRG